MEPITMRGPLTDEDRKRIQEAPDGMVVQIPKPEPPSPLALVEQAIAKGMDPQAVLDFIERANKMKAAEVFAAAIAKFQAECPQILKERMVKTRDGGRLYNFASFDDIMKAINPLLKECGIAVTFSVAPTMTGNLLVGTCFVRVGSHCVETTLPIPIAKGINTNDAQNFGGTMTYLKRYLLCAALNIVVTDELEKDTDGVLFVNAEELAALKELIDKTNTDLARFLKWAECPALEQLPQGKFAAAVSMLGKKVSK